MEEKRIEQVLEIEKRAQELYDAAVREAQQLPLQAEQEAQATLERVKAEAQAEARKMVEQAQSDAETARILREAEGKSKDFETAAKKNFDRAVRYILDQVAGGK